MKLVYSDQYDLNLGEHVFQSIKYKLTKEKLVSEEVVSASDVLAPDPASDDDIARVHTHEYIRKLKEGALSYQEIMTMEVPYSPQLVNANWFAAGGTMLAARRAVEDGVAMNVGGGFHHAFPNHGEGFCVIHDVAVAIRRLQADGVVQTAMTVDCDVHQGNGTAFIFRDDPTVFTFSIHQERNYPAFKPPGDFDVNLVDGVGDEEYLAALDKGLDASLGRFAPDIIFYIAGADPYCEDQLGGLNLSFDGLMSRDRMVFEKARRKNVPVTVTLAGGYARHVEDTVQIHANTARVAKNY